MYVWVWMDEGGLSFDISSDFGIFHYLSESSRFDIHGQMKFNQVREGTRTEGPTYTESTCAVLTNSLARNTSNTTLFLVIFIFYFLLLHVTY